MSMSTVEHVFVVFDRTIYELLGGKRMSCVFDQTCCKPVFNTYKSVATCLC